MLIVFFSVSVLHARGPMAVKIGKGEALITVLEGSARVQSGGDKTWRSLKTGNLVRGGDEIQVDKRSRMEIRLPDQSALRFSEDTRFKIVAIDISDESKTRTAKVNLALGKTWANVSKMMGGNPNYEMASRNAVCGVRGTVYRMNVEKNAAVLVRVYEGEVNVSGGKKSEQPQQEQSSSPQKIAGPIPVEGPRKVSMEEWTYIVKSKQQIRIGTDGTAQKPEAFSEAEDRDAWVDWNKARDAEMDKPLAQPGRAEEKSWLDWFRKTGDR
jgi:ferric-dicitrate binding protein FerR (iron transport regulator)